MKLRLPRGSRVSAAAGRIARCRCRRCCAPRAAAAPAPTLPAEFNTQTGQRIRVTMVAGGLFHPWSIVFPDARTILVAERNGKIRVIRDGVLQAQPVWEAPPHPASDNGLQFLALHPQFAQNRSRLPVVSEARRQGNDARHLARPLRRHDAAPT